MRAGAPWRWPGSSVYPAGEARALAYLGVAANGAGDYDRAVRLARQAGQVTDGIPGSDSPVGQLRLDWCADRGRGPGRRRARLRGHPGPARDAGDLYNQANLLSGW